MMIEAIKVRRVYGEKIIEFLGRLNLIHRGKKIKKVDDFIIIPLIRKPSEEELNLIFSHFQDAQLCMDFFEDKFSRPRSIAEVLRDFMSKSELNLLPKSFDIIGDIAIIEIPPELSSFKHFIGEALMKVNSKVKTVFAKKSAINGVFRIRELEHIAGDFSSVTFHREYGCVFKVDVLKVYFSPRLSFERYRVSRQVRDGEIVVDMFSGVGPFSIMIAKYSQVDVYSIDLNPCAVALLNENLRLNKLRGWVYPILSDANYTVNLFRCESFADRIIMNLPESSHLFLDKAVRLVKSGGIIHYYCFSGDGDPVKRAYLKLVEILEECGVKDFSITSMRKVKPIAPYKWQVAIDIKIFK